MPAATRERITRAEHEAMPLAAAYIRLQLEQERAEQAAASGRYRWNPRPEQRTPDGDWRIWYIETGRGWGKALALDTPIPTSSGWTTMGEIAVGETVFDEQGQPCRVTFVSPVMLGNDCYQLTFSDGMRVVADAEHEWLTIDRRARKAAGRAISPRHGPIIVTTRHIADTLYDSGEVNHAIPLAGALACPLQDLPIDPYVLGAWLGDGSTRGAELTCVDPEILDAVEAAGHTATRYRQAEGKAPRYGLSDLRMPLRQAGLLGNKHVPSAYLRASVAQRLALLQGLMDTDGSVDIGGNCEFCTTSSRLANDVHELCSSLRIKSTLLTGRATLDGRDCGVKYRVNFTSYISVFQLPRKQERLHAPGAQAQRQLRRYIVACELVPSVPVRCIQVDSPSHMFLCTRAMIPTHNTRTAAEDVKAFALANPSSRIAVVAPTFDDARDVCVEGESGLLSILPPGAVASWNRSFGQLFLTNGSRFDLYSAEKPDSLRGPQHHRAWGDECAFWRYGPETFANLMLGLRLGHGPRVVLTTTPRPARPLIKDVKSRPNVHITRGSMLDNAANLAPEFVADMLRQYQGTRLGRQEIEGVELDDNPAALWHRANIDANRVLRAPQLRRIVVGVDPAATAAETSSETGIVTAGLGADGHGYILDDASLHASPAGWAAAAITAYHKHCANLIVAEVNHGGDMVEHTLASIERLPFKAVRASRGKYTRAEPIASLYERGMVHHVGGFAELEDQLCSWQPGDASPDRLDALVWALAELFPLQAEAPMIAPVGIARTSPSPMRFV